mgnify:CR=1 FL=1
MATRAELIQMCQELDIDYSGMSSEQMADAVRSAADKAFIPKFKHIRVGADSISPILKKFLYKEYDFIFRDRDGNLLDHNYNIVRKARKK